MLMRVLLAHARIPHAVIVVALLMVVSLYAVLAILSSM